MAEAKCLFINWEGLREEKGGRSRPALDGKRRQARARLPVPLKWHQKIITFLSTLWLTLITSALHKRFHARPGAGAGIAYSGASSAPCGATDSMRTRKPGAAVCGYSAPRLANGQGRGLNKSPYVDIIVYIFVLTLLIWFNYNDGVGKSDAAVRSFTQRTRHFVRSPRAGIGLHPPSGGGGGARKRPESASLARSPAAAQK